ncbi:MAG: hypothetical protein K6D92_02025 [Erysipelotrichaceae bacterium]|nr:hypothetical protein [Erysipelotrichaceae bacterium]
MGMKANSGLFSNSLRTPFGFGSEHPKKYTDRGIEIPAIVKTWMNELRFKGDKIVGNKNDFSEKEVSILSKETGVEYARLTIGDKTYLVRGDETGTDIPPTIFRDLVKEGGSLDYHSHPYDNDIIPSISDRNLMRRLKRLTGQQSSKIVTPNGKSATFNEYGVIEIGSVSNMIDEKSRKMYEELFGGKK